MDETRIYIDIGLGHILEYSYITILLLSVILLVVVYFFPNIFHIYPLFKEFFWIFLIFSIVMQLIKLIFLPWLRDPFDVIFVISLIILYLFFNVFYSSTVLFENVVLIVSSSAFLKLLIEVGKLRMSCSYPPELLQ